MEGHNRRSDAITAEPPVYESIQEKAREPISDINEDISSTQLPAYESVRKNKGGSSDDDAIGTCSPDDAVGSIVNETADLEQQKAASGHAHFHRLGWKRLTVVMIVEAIALGSLSLPATFAALGMVAGVILCIGIGIIAIYTSYIIGQVKLKFPYMTSYADAGQRMMGRFGYELFGAMFVLLLIFLTASHCLTGTIAFRVITESGICSIIFGVVSAILLFLLAIPPSFAEVAILGYVDFVSILLAIGITIIGTGVVSGQAPGGLAAVNWSAWPKEDLNFSQAFIAVSNICFAYSFAMCQFSFMDEMHTPKDYVKSITLLGAIEIVIYTVTGAVVYAFVGDTVKSPALLSAGPLLARIAFGVALPVIFISGSINITVLGRYLHGRMFKKSVVRFINTKTGWLTWLGLIAVITILSFIIAEAIPIFQDLLSIISALFISGFTFYLPSLMWYMMLMEGKWYDWKNLPTAILNLVIFIIGLVVLVGGMYASVIDIMYNFATGHVGGSFTCGAPG
ncbi:probable neutral amino acid permease [Cephalotrichum gorgonifer]|uniref:Probable neutral amino acid permease n=1 Tax=Cephalotrichum gorgonifer TaxID=2041049 RepID=A0AAE8MNA4_9PEZI|nr:probable neutral amino acid permease [Cephalotrichum gorgonifer]